ncbi:MAG TPA: ribonuclease III [Candidatus Acidoferrales bacterium]|nr:ribonuclease III [Candidatus Acidoferrales bacterium]
MTDPEREDLEARLGHRFHKIGWLERALTHRSHTFLSEEHHNERLEFLGDSVLGLAVSQVLVLRFPDWEEGSLSKARARLVSAASAEVAANRLRLGDHLRLGPGEEKTGGRKKRNLLADAYEAVVGAIFRDAGFEPAAAFVERTLLHDTRFTDSLLDDEDNKSALQELLQGRGIPPAEYRVVKESGPEHQKIFRVSVRVDGRSLAEGEGRSKKSAEQAAAGLALKALLAEHAGDGKAR